MRENSSYEKELSPRLMEILQHAAEGKTDKEIAKLLGITTDTVETHWKRLRTHFSSSSRTQIVADAMRRAVERELEETIREKQLLIYEMAERNRAEQALREANALLEKRVAERTEELADMLVKLQMDARARHERDVKANHLLETAHVCGVVCMTAEIDEPYRVISVSDNVSQFGYDAEDLLSGKVPLLAMLHAEDALRLYNETQNWRMLEGQRLQIEYRLLPPQGDPRWILHRACLRTDENGKKLAYICQIDITDLKECEFRIRREMDKLRLRLKEMEV